MDEVLTVSAVCLLGSDKWSTLKGRLPGVPHADTLVAILYVRFRLF